MANLASWERGADLFFFCGAATVLSVQIPLQHSQDSGRNPRHIHSCYFRSSNESHYHLHHGLVSDGCPSVFKILAQLGFKLVTSRPVDRRINRLSH